MLEVADVLRRYGGAYLDRFGDAVPQRHRRAIRDIIDCRTSALGGHIYACDYCGHHHFSYHSCRNRNCPKCHGHNVQAWLEARRTELLPVPYFHVVFTLPKALRRIVRSHPKPLYGILMKSAAQALMKLAADPRYVGGKIGILAVLHTWTRTLEYHPHVHCLVPGGGLSPDGAWIPSRPDFLVPIKALSKIFRGLFADFVRRTCPHITLPQSIWNQDWVVYVKATVQGADRVLDYLARYVHRVAITNSRILSIDDGQVVFRYQRVGDATWKTMALEAHEFIRRFLQHVLPAGVHKVRYYGLWAPANRKLLHRIQHELAKEEPRPTEQETLEPSELTRRSHPLEGETCPHCGEGILVWLAAIPRPPRGPPQLILAPRPHVAPR
jgi:hypothetical protein